MKWTLYWYIEILGNHTVKKISILTQTNSINIWFVYIKNTFTNKYFLIKNDKYYKQEFFFFFLNDIKMGIYSYLILQI